MGVIDSIKKLFKKGGMYMAGKDLDTIFDHERIDFDKDEYNRIKDSMKLFRGKFNQVEYLNSKGKKMKRDFYDLNMMKEVASHLARVLYNEKCTVSVTGASKELIEEVLERTQFNKNFAGYLEPMLALGGLIAKPYYDTSTGNIEISWALADTFIPLHSNTNDISEGAFTSTTIKTVGDTQYYYTLLEFHEWENGKYVITNELYRSEKEDKLGKQVLLSELYENLSERTEYEGFTRPNFVYLKPSGFNNINPDSPLGIGVCDNAKNTLKFINTAYDQYYWEVKQGKRRIIVSDHFLRKEVTSDGKLRDYFDDETDIFQAVPGDMDNMQNNDITHDIRSDSYISTINKMLSTLEMQTGLSAGTFTFDAEGVKTATEVVSRDSTTYRTRNSHLTNVEQFIKELARSITELARETYTANGKPLYNGDIPEDKDIVVSFDDGVFTSREQELDFIAKADSMGTIPLVQKIMRVWELDEETANEWAKLLKAEIPEPTDTTEQAFDRVFGERE